MSAPAEVVADVVGEMRECLAAAPYEKFPASQVRGWMEALEAVAPRWDAVEAEQANLRG